MEEPTLVRPDEIILDTSFVVAALIRNQPNHDTCLAFLEHLAEAGTLVVFDRLLELELA